MMDDIVEEVGEENVVQIVTDNAANYKLVGQMLMDKRNKLYWTPCAAHCIDIMLEDFESKIPMHKEIIASGKKITTYIYAMTGLITLLHHYTEGSELIRPGITRFATSYLCLGCLNDKRGGLYRMFTFKQWKDSQFSKTKDEKLVENIVTNMDFWKNLIIFLKGAFPLLKVLRMVDSDEKAAMGYIYEAMDHAKEEIQTSYINKRKRPLHATGYYLNPLLHYKPNFKADNEVKQGMYACFERMMGGDMHMMNKIDGQLENFKRKKGFSGSEIAQYGLENKTPTQWWESYSDAHPELQNFAIRILSLTCSSSGYGNHVNVADLDEDLMQRTFAKSSAHVDEFDVHEIIESDNEEGNADKDGGRDDDNDYGGGDDEINEDGRVDIMEGNPNYRRICDLY
ncbi:hypothetical protein KIW84_056341 [Lathyrus oleraceus]|uniref:DUF659 domain-containing protein n=1 Tax=Pisum sativum TaxID=3888 RepID=A0A9D4WZ46_PEA|nr:hypothetical protein KIW84_056341 [Pisum sativum]